MVFVRATIFFHTRLTRFNLFLDITLAGERIIMIKISQINNEYICGYCASPMLATGIFYVQKKIRA